jgi:pimeloyl-ACP methyl ester carboxylesterase
VTALSNEFTAPQVDAWRDSLRRIEALALLVAGHLVHDARPAEFNAVVTSFLRRPGDALRSVAT